MSARRKARKRALDVIFAADVRGADIIEVLEAETAREHPDPAKYGDTDYASTLIYGVAGNVVDIDRLLQEVATDWPLGRLAAVDRAILRLASYEIIYRDDIPTAVAVSEAGELAQEYSTDESRNFVQGVLGALAKRHETLPDA